MWVSFAGYSSEKNSAIRRNVTTLLLLKEKTFPLFLSLPCTCSPGSQSAGTWIVTHFMVCSLLSDTETPSVSTLEGLGQELNRAAEHGRGEWSKSRHQPSRQPQGFSEMWLELDFTTPIAMIPKPSWCQGVPVQEGLRWEQGAGKSWVCCSCWPWENLW